LISYLNKEKNHDAKILENKKNTLIDCQGDFCLVDNKN